MKPLQHLPRFFAAALFAGSAAAAVAFSGASHAGAPARGPLSSAPQAAQAGVIVGVAVGIGGPHRYGRYAYTGGAWTRVGFVYGTAPGYVGGYYLGYGPPAPGFLPPGYYGPHPYYRHPYYGRPVYGPYRRPYWHARYGPGPVRRPDAYGWR